MLSRVHLVVDAAGDYEVPSDSIFAIAPKRKDGGWDRRYVASREAIALFEANQAKRLKEVN